MIPDPTPLPADLAGALTLAGDRLAPLLHRFLWYPEVGSTNDVAGTLAEQGADEGTVVIADRQTAGRGRRGRSWASPPGAGLYLSVVLRPSASAAVLLTIAAGVAVADGVGAATGLRPHLKWPNDVEIDGRKLAGILAEGAVRHVVLGIGVNVQRAAYPPEIGPRATSIETELGRPVDRGLVLAECLAALSSRYREMRREGGHGIVEAWRQRAASTLGRSVEWQAGSERKVGVVENIGEDGALLVNSGAAIVRITSGEVRWL